LGHDLAYEGVIPVQRLRDLVGGFYEETEWKGPRPKQTRYAQIAVNRSGLRVHNHEEVHIAIRSGGAIDIGPKKDDLVWVQSGDQTMHNLLERFFGYRREARRLQPSDHRYPPDGPLVVAHPCALLSPYMPVLLILLYPCRSLFLGNVLGHGHTTLSASPYNECNTSRRACATPPEILTDTLLRVYTEEAESSLGGACYL